MSIDLTQLSDEELDIRYFESDDIDFKLEILDEKNRRNPLPAKPDDSSFTCENCGS